MPTVIDYFSTGLASKTTFTSTYEGASRPRTIIPAAAASGKALQKRFFNRFLA